MNVAGLFAGIGGLEEGLHRAGHEASLLCEIDKSAAAVLSEHFPGIRLIHDIRDRERILEALGDNTDLVTAGFPCQDLSQVGRTDGIGGERSGLVEHLFQILRVRRVPFVLLENVPFMLKLHRGQAMRYLVGQLADMGYSWAYRVLDTHAFGLPQRRRRVFVLASTEMDPAGLLLSHDEGIPSERKDPNETAYGFYWTEGNRGLGWAIDAVPPLKGGSSVNIPSPPAIWLPSGQIVTPDIRDAERLQGFPEDWTVAAETEGSTGNRWKLVGNAVTVDVAHWIGCRLNSCEDAMERLVREIDQRQGWPNAGYGHGRHAYQSHASPWPVRQPQAPLEDFLKHDPKPLSKKATRGFLGRLQRSKLRYPPAFADALAEHAALLS